MDPAQHVGLIARARELLALPVRFQIHFVDVCVPCKKKYHSRQHIVSFCLTHITIRMPLIRNQMGLSFLCFSTISRGRASGDGSDLGVYGVGTLGQRLRMRLWRLSGEIWEAVPEVVGRWMFGKLAVGTLDIHQTSRSIPVSEVYMSHTSSPPRPFFNVC